MIYEVTPLHADHAREILTWRYPAPYDFYDPPDDGNADRYVAAFLDPVLRFHAVLDAGRLAGFCSYGLDGQVPGGDYSQEALDIGLGMRPDLTGQGAGGAFFEAILQRALHWQPERLRLTVADFNLRAMRLYRRFGFAPVSGFVHDQTPYTVLMRHEA